MKKEPSAWKQARDFMVNDPVMQVALCLCLVGLAFLLVTLSL